MSFVKKLGLSFFILCVAWCVFFLWMTRFLPGELARRSQRFLQSDLKIGKTTTNFLNSFHFHDIQIQEPYLGKISTLSVSFQPWRLIAFPAKNRQIIKVTLTEPQFTLKKESFQKNTSKNSGLVFPSLLVELMNGKITYPEKNQDFVLSNISGAISLFPSGFRGDINANFQDIGMVKTKAEGTAESWNASFESKSLDLGKAWLLLHQQKENAQGIIRGNGNFNLKAKGTLQPFQINPDWVATLESQKASFETSLLARPIPLKFQLATQTDTLFIKSMEAFNGVNVSGLINSPWKKPVLQLSAKAESLPLSSFLQIVSSQFDSDLWNGETSLNATMEGSLQNPQINGNLSLIASYWKVNVPPVEAQFSYKNRAISALGKFAGGKIDFSGAFDQKNRGKYNVNVKNVSLQKMGEANNWKNVQGLFNSNLVWNNRQNTIDLDGGFYIDDFQWGRLSSPKRSEGNLRIKDKQIQITTNDNSIALNGFLNKSIAQLETFKLDFGNNFTFSARGTVDLLQEQMNFDLQGTQIQPDLWPPLVARYPQAEGSLDVAGTVSGKLQNPNAQMNVVFQNFKFIPEGEKWNGTTEIRGNKSNFSLKKIIIDGGYSGDLAWRKSPRIKSGVWSTHINFQNSNPRLLFDVLKSTRSTAGQISGALNVEWDGTQSLGTSSMTWINGKINDFAFDSVSGSLDMKEKKWELKNVVLVRGDQALRSQGEIEKKKNLWDYDLTFQFQRWGTPPFGLDGELRSEGVYNENNKMAVGKIWSPVFWLGENSLENLEANLNLTRESIRIKGDAGPDFVFDVQTKKNTNLFGKIKGKSFRAENLIRPFFPDKENHDILIGQVGFLSTLKGTLENPKLEIQAQLENGVWRNEKMNGEIALEIESSSITLQSSKAILERGGTLFLNGYFDRKQPRQFDLKGIASNASLESVFHFLKWPMKWEGNTDASFSVEGKKDSTNLDIAFTGRHQGWGPFKNEGSLQGTVKGDLKELDLTNIQVQSGNGFARLLNGSRVFLEKNGSGTMRLAVESRNLRAGYLTFFGNAELTGSWQKENPNQKDVPVDLDVFARSLWINQFYLDGNVTHLTIKKGEMDFSPIPGSQQKISGTMFYKDYPAIEVKDFKFIDDGVEKVNLRGLVGPERWDYILKLKEVDASAAQGIFDFSFPISGPLDADLEGRGSVSAPYVQGHVHCRNGFYGIVPLDTADADVTFRNDILSLRNISVTKKKGYQLRGSVSVDTQENSEGKRLPAEIDLKLEKGELSLLTQMFEGISMAKGNFEGELRVRPVNGRSKTEGLFKAQKISLQSRYTPELEKGTINVSLHDNLLKISEAVATVGRGILNLAGTISFENTIPQNFNLTLKSLTGEGSTIRIPQLAINPGPVLGKLGFFRKKLVGVSRGEPLIDVKLEGPASAPVLSGNIILKNSVFTYPSSVPSSTDPRSKSTTKWLQAFLKKIFWDLKLEAGNRTWYQNEQVDAAITGALKFSGPTSGLITSGKIRTEQGSIVYAGNEFKVKEAELEIETPEMPAGTLQSKQTFVYLKAVAEREVFYTDALSANSQDVIVMVVDRSLIGEVQPRFYSKNNPNLSSQRALQLALGLPFTDSIEENILLPDQRATDRVKNKDETDKLLRVGLVQLLDSSLASPLARALAQRTGLVDFIRVTYQENDPNADPNIDLTATGSQSNNITQNQFLRYAKGTKVKLGRGLSRRLFADYSFRVDEFQEKIDLRHEVELAYRVHQNFFLRGITELDSERTLGRPPDRRAILENQWRFGLPKKKASKTTLPKEETPSSQAPTPSAN